MELEFSKYLSPTLNIQPDDFQEEEEIVVDKSRFTYTLNRSSSQKKQFVSAKFTSLMSTNPVQVDTSRYKYVNLNSSNNSSMSRTSSLSKSRVNRTTNKIIDLDELNRGKKAYEFREKLKRSTSNKRISLERTITHQLGTGRPLKNTPALARINSEKSFTLRKSYQTSMRSLYNPIKKSNKLSKYGGSKQMHPFAQSLRDIKIPKDVSQISNLKNVQNQEYETEQRKNTKLRFDLERTFNKDEDVQKSYQNVKQEEVDFNKTQPIKFKLHPPDKSMTDNLAIEIENRSR